jgi:glycine/D-amino acid oxidase-like deaminating enzyme
MHKRSSINYKLVLIEPMYDLIVVIKGVLGNFHHHALKKGFRVAIIEKEKMPKGATIQNFGQVVHQEWTQNGKL